MPTLRIKIVLNKGRRGIPLNKLASISEETLRFLGMACEDAGVTENPADWLAVNFENGSLIFDCEKPEIADLDVFKRAQLVIQSVIAPNTVPAQFTPHIRPTTKLQYSQIAKRIDADEAIDFGIYRNGEAVPSTLYELNQTVASRIAATIPTTAQYHGEIQGLVHAFYKEAKKPYLVVRELSTRALIDCFFAPEMYRSAIEVLQERDSVVFVEGEVTESLIKGVVESIQVTDFTLAPKFSISELDAFMGSDPGCTGELSSEDFLSKYSHDDEA